MARSELAHSVRRLPTTAAKIRALAQKGHPRAEIARALGIRYQHVRNVLIQDEAKAAKADEASTSRNAMTKGARIPIGPEGKAIIPESLINAIGVKPGDVLFAHVHDGEIQLLTRTAVTRRVQTRIRQFVPEGVSLVDELLEDRRREVEAESQDG